MSTSGVIELLGAAVAVSATSRLKVSRSLRRLVLPIAGAGVLVYRVVNGSNTNFLAEISMLVELIAERLVGVGSSSRRQLLTRILQDALGLGLCTSVLTSLLQPGTLSGYSGGSSSSFRKDFLEYVYQMATDLPLLGAVLRKKVAKEAEKMEGDLEIELKAHSRAIGKQNGTLPVVGIPGSEILQLMKIQTAKENVVWQTGHVSGAVYHGISDHQDLLNQAFGLYSIANPLHPDIWPSGMKFESEIIAMTASLVAGGESTVCGCTTSGGTESIILAVKSHRDFYRRHFGITAPEVVCCVSAHAAVDKACDLMNIKLIKVPMNAEYKADISAIRASIGPNTIMIYASAPSYPQGTIDNIEELSELAARCSVGLHVDCCLGGFVLPFMKKLGFHLPKFDFSLPGVTSMSLDTHKYGYALKGASVVLYRTKELRQAQYFCYADWTGGMYTTPTIAGSRSGGLIAQCWASLMAMGEEGYMKHTKDIVESTRMIAEGVRGIQGLELFGGAEVMIVCFGAAKRKAATDGSPPLNVYSVSDYMSKTKGWSLNALQNPPCVHLCITVRHVGHEEAFLRDLREAVQHVLSSDDKLGGKAAIYGMTSGLPSGPVNTLLKAYNDVVLKL